MYLGWRPRARIAFTMTALASLASAGLAETRTWTDSTGKHKIEAEFIEIVEGQVKLKKPDGKQVSLPLGKLSKEDQLFLRALLKERRAAQAAEAAPAAGPAFGRGRAAGPGFKKGDRVMSEWAGKVSLGTVVSIDPNSGWLEVVMDGSDDQRPEHRPASYYKPYDAAAKATLPPEGWVWTPPAMKPAIAADYSSVRRPAGAVAATTIAPDPAAPSTASAAAKGALIPRPVSTWEKRQGIDVVASSPPLAVVLYRGGEEMNSADSRLEVLDLASGERRATLSAPAKTGAVAVSPSGKRIATTEGSGVWDNALQVAVWELGDKSLNHVVSWNPYPGEDRESKIAWHRWLSDERLLTKSAGGKVVLWDASSAKALFEIDAGWYGLPVVSPGGKQFALPAAKGVEIFSTDDGDRLATVPASGGVSASIAFSPSGAKMSVISGRGVEVLDLATGKRLAEFYAGEGVARGNWLDERFMLVNSGLVLDTQSMCVLWKYFGGSPLGASGGSQWVALGGESAPRARTASGEALVPFTLPHAAAIAAAPKGPEALALKPGDQVSIDVTAVDGSIAEEARAHIADGLAKAGFVVADGAAAKVAASIRAGEAQEMNYRSFGIRGGEEKFSVNTRHYDLSLAVGADELWKSSGYQAPPAMVQLKEGESIQEVVSREMGLKGAMFPAKFPSNIVSKQAREPRGISELTASGIQ